MIAVACLVLGGLAAAIGMVLLALAGWGDDAHLGGEA